VIIDSRYTQLTTQNVQEAYAKQKGRRAKGKIIFSLVK
jgi:hypothetical protein